MIKFSNYSIMSEINDHDLQDKHIFLRKEIVDNKYNLEAFLEYIKNRKQGGENIDSWSMDELKEIVSQYIKFYNLLKQDSPGNSESERTSRNKSQKESKKYERFLDRQFGNIEIVIDKPEIVTNGGFLGFGVNSVLWYTLKTSISQKQVKRADADFDWLRSTLIQLHPNRILPPLGKAKTIQPNDTKELFKRGRMIKMFIEGLSKCEVLINCKLTISFLIQQDYSKIQALKKQFSQNIIPSSPSQFVTQSGKVELQISPQNSSFLKNVGIYNSATRQIYSQIRQTIKDALKNFQNITGSIYKIGNGFASLQQKHSILMNNIPSLNNDNFNQTLVGLNNCMVEWGRTFNVQRKAVEKYLSLVLKFNVQQAQIFQKVLKKRSIIQQQYTKLRIQLHKKKQKLVSSNPILNQIQIPFSINQKVRFDKITKQDIQKIIPSSQLKAQKDLRQMLGSYNASCKSEFIRLQPIIKDRMVTAFKSLGKILLQSNKSETDVIMRLINCDY